jgi:hypothetical protein
MKSHQLESCPSSPTAARPLQPISTISQHPMFSNVYAATCHMVLTLTGVTLVPVALYPSAANVDTAEANGGSVFRKAELSLF